MPAAIPVRIGQQEYSSLNQARIHYQEILHRTQLNKSSSEADKQQIMELLTASLLVPTPLNTQNAKICVVNGYYGRRCFELRDETGANRLSMTRAIRGCALTKPAVPEQEKTGVVPA